MTWPGVSEAMPAKKKIRTAPKAPRAPRVKPVSEPMGDEFLELIRKRNAEFAKKIKAGGPGVKAGDVIALHSDVGDLLKEIDRLRDRKTSHRLIEDLLKKTTLLAASSGIEESDAVSLVARSWPN